MRVFIRCVGILLLGINLAHASSPFLFPDVGKAIQKAVQDAGNAVSKAVQDSTNDVFSQLEMLPLDKLYLLKVSDDVCSTGVLRCGPIPKDRVKSFVDVELDRRKAVSDASDKDRTFYISFAGLVISCCAVAISGVSAFAKKKKADPIET